MTVQVRGGFSYASADYDSSPMLNTATILTLSGGLKSLRYYVEFQPMSFTGSPGQNYIWLLIST